VFFRFRDRALERLFDQKPRFLGVKAKCRVGAKTGETLIARVISRTLMAKIRRVLYR